MLGGLAAAGTASYYAVTDIDTQLAMVSGAGPLVRLMDAELAHVLGIQVGRGCRADFWGRGGYLRAAYWFRRCVCVVGGYYSCGVDGVGRRGQGACMWSNHKAAEVGLCGDRDEVLQKGHVIGGCVDWWSASRTCVWQLRISVWLCGCAQEQVVAEVARAMGGRGVGRGYALWAWAR